VSRSFLDQPPRLRAGAVLFSGSRDQFFIPGDLVLYESRLVFFRTTNVVIEACLKLSRLYRPKPKVEIDLSDLRNVQVSDRAALIRFLTPPSLLELTTSTSHFRFGVANGEEWLQHLTAAPRPIS
jgi:hypothetical protein